MKKTIVTISGIRPDFIRMSQIFKKFDAEFNHILIHTGQHYDELLSDVFFQDLEIRKPDYNLSIGGPGKTHYEQQAELTLKLPPLIKEINPDFVGFLGDSNSVLASIPLRKEGFKIFHIEAGMRSGDMRMPEEINRIACDHASNIRFVYHGNYLDKLNDENLSSSNYIVGNTIVEPFNIILDKLKDEPLEERYIILDIHRPENFLYPKRLQTIIEVAQQHSIEFGIPVYMLSFSRTMDSIKQNSIDLGNIEVIPLMGYIDFVRFMKSCKFLISDSGTAQEEPSLIGKKVLVPREFTERPESYEHGCSMRMDIEYRSKSAYEWESQYLKQRKYDHIHSDWLLSPDKKSTSDLITSILNKLNLQV